MTPKIGAPGDGITRREFVAATGTTGAVAAAGCMTTTDPTVEERGNTASTLSQSLPTTSPPEVVDLNEQGNSVTLKTVRAAHRAHPGESMGGPVNLPMVWAWQADDGDPSVPGPILRIDEGSEFEVTLDNSEAEMPHTFHLHGIHKTWENDGVPTTTGITVGPGETHTYEFTANVPGTHIYHCHYQTPRHMEMGMYGTLRVDPQGYEPADKEYFMTVKEWDSRLSRQLAGQDATYDITNRRPDVFTINGKCAPRTLNPEDGSPIVVSSGDTVRLHWVNAGFRSHPLHMHNHRFEVVERDGSQIPDAARYKRDVQSVSPAERYTVEFEADADPGIYLMHCHKVDHVRNGSSYPGGMLTGIVYEEAMDTDIFADLMDYAGYEG
ncbi:multicopper oxidase domain-containing protein [Halosegnis rubeus]|uniref:Multicopper oxidase domain-containing protein n=1 Tax=Halosegnis rubeus TaxID=2212850 RepID=A0A5N5ULA7_9EURY|nr:multicopper oxidase domain-containing protein [Halosegnis rubeus]KAB7519707.1 multicopper oxidase domain-containing protein [Halosegnis rubeus]